MTRNIQNNINSSFSYRQAKDFNDPNYFTSVKWADRAPGDFIQFEPRPPLGNNWHVGRLTDVNRFIGSQSSTGVAEVNFATNPYWNKRAQDGYAHIFRYTGPSASDSNNSPQPSSVGGVKLRGIGNALKDLGPLKGIAVDPNGRLVLITAEQGEVKLPPLRIDDVVTIFRAAYRQGEAPYVSIDPDKKDAHGPTMDIRHSPGTEDTFVGWVLFETDRVMKAFSLGKDNLTGQRIQTTIPGYRSTPELAWDDPPRDEKNKLWARYWIVPAEVKRRKAKSHQLTLLDVPLKVDTEPVIPRDGKLESVPGAKSNPSSETFARWFGGHIEDLARGIWSTPPAESGWKEKVPVFAELQRIALIAATAEQLRDQNVPLPAWMREHTVPPFRMPRTTPTMTGESVRKEGTRSVFGGAQMTPPRQRIIEVDSPEAEALAPHVFEAVAKVPSLTPVRFQHGGQSYQALALPGDDTQALGAARLEETDLSLPLPGENALRLIRTFDSFHQPNDVFGGAWTLDLPRLDVQFRRLPAQGKTVPMRRVYQLTSPLGTWCEAFMKEEQVPGGPSSPIAVPSKPGDMLGAYKLKEGPNVLQFRDGRNWRFDDDGYLLEREELPLRVVYQRDGRHRITRLEGRYGQAVRVHIDLRYDDQGRLVEAAGSEGGSVRYKYDAAGLLSEVQRPGEILAYRYEGGRVLEVLRNGSRLKRFEYNSQGEVLSESRGGDEKRVFEITNVPEGVQITTASPDQPGRKETVVYDTAYRPLRMLSTDGDRVEYRYEDSGAVTMTFQSRRSEPLMVRRSADGREETWQIAGGSQARLRFTASGQLQEFVQDGRRLLLQECDARGLPRRIVTGGMAYQPSFDSDHIPTWLLIKPEGAPDASSEFVQIRYNDRGLPSLLRENGGMLVKLDASGEVLEWSLYENPRTKEKKDWVKFSRDEQGRVRAVETTWGHPT
jgi:YD repeat-containing protein